jgi:WD40 repeat protein
MWVCMGVCACVSLCVLTCVQQLVPACLPLWLLEVGLVSGSLLVQGAVYDVAATSNGFISGGVNGKLCVWQELSDEETQLMDEMEVGAAVEGVATEVRSICAVGEVVVVGCGDGSICNVDLETNEVEQISTSHALGELWALAAHPQQPIMASGSNDCTVRLWDLEQRRVVGCNIMPSGVRCLAFSNDAVQ